MCASIYIIWCDERTEVIAQWYLSAAWPGNALLVHAAKTYYRRGEEVSCGAGIQMPRAANSTIALNASEASKLGDTPY
jgi:hypothetical protein